jgi:hypothetical protein
MTDDKRLYEQIKYPFTDEEVRAMGEALARESQNVISLREEKALVAAAISAQIKEANQRAVELATRINNRYEMREVEVVLLMDVPRPGMKGIARIENPDDVIRYEPMSAAEKQATFGFNLSQGEE